MIFLQGDQKVKTIPFETVLQMFVFMTLPIIACGILGVVRRFSPTILRDKKKNEGLNRLAPAAFILAFTGALATAAGLPLGLSVVLGITSLLAIRIGEYFMA